jgi:hypothetical protein
MMNVKQKVHKSNCKLESWPRRNNLTWSGSGKQ